MIQDGIRWWKGAVLYLLPIVALIAIDVFVLQRATSTFPNDTAPGMLGIGLGWLTGDPLPTFHHPGTTFQQLGGLILWMDLASTQSLTGYNSAGIVIHVLFAVGSAIWVGWLAGRMGIGAPALVLLGAVVVLMPTMALYSTLWALYFPLGLLVVPLCLHLLRLAGNDPLRRNEAFFVLAALGFLCENLYTAIVVALAALVGLLLAHSAPQRLLDRFQPVQGGRGLRFTLRFIALAGLSVAVAATLLLGLATARGTAEPTLSIPGDGLPWVIGISLSLVLSLLVEKSTAPGKWIDSLAVPPLLGWTCAANIAIPHWFVGGAIAVLRKGGAAPADLSQRELDIAGYLSTSSWLTFALLALTGTGIVAAVSSRRVESERRSMTRFVAGFCLVALVLNVFAAADVTLYRNPAASPGLAQFGQPSRYYLMMLGPVAVALVWLGGWLRGRWAGILYITVSLCCAMSAYEYVRAVSTMTRLQGPATRRLEALVESHLGEDPRNLVLCVHTVVPDACGVLYAFNTYRTDQSRADLPVPRDWDSRLAYLPTFDSIAGLRLQENGGEILIISEGEPPDLPTREVHYSELGVSAITLPTLDLTDPSGSSNTDQD